MISEESVKATPPVWRPANKMAELKAKKGYTARWVNNDPANIAKKKAEGWIVMKPEDEIGTFSTSYKDVNDGKALGTGIVFRDSIAMMIPDELKAAREEFMRQENANAMSSILNKTDDKIKQTGASTYKPKGMSGRIVID